MKVKITFRQPPRNNREKRYPTSWLLRLVSGLLFTLVISYFIYTPQARVIEGGNPKIGDIAADDIVVSKNVTVEDRDLNELHRRKAMSQVIPVYEWDGKKGAASQNIVDEWLRYIRDTRRRYLKSRLNLTVVAEEIKRVFALSMNESDIGWLLERNVFGRLDSVALLEDIRRSYERGILLSKPTAPRSADQSIQVYSDPGGYSVRKLDDLLDAKDMAAQLNVLMDRSGISQKRDRQLAIAVLLDFIPVNVSYSRFMTGAAEKVALGALNPAYIHLKKVKSLFAAAMK